MDGAALLSAYDEHLRTEAEVRAAVSGGRLGPLWLARFAGDEGFITYRDLVGITDIDGLVSEALSRFSGDASIREVEWKSRSHDVAPGLHEALVAHGFVPQEPESIMIGELHGLVAEAPHPAGLTVRRVTEEGEVRAVSALQDLVFEGAVSEANADELMRRLNTDPHMQLWAAEVSGEFVAAGRVELVPGTPFAGLWAGATREEWRGRGIYRALTAARAAAALERGKALAHSDSTENSRPILERSGMVKVSTTTPYIWRR